MDTLHAAAAACRLPSRTSIEAAVSAVSDPRLCHWCEPGLQQMALALVRMAGLAPRLSSEADESTPDASDAENRVAPTAVLWWAAMLRCVPAARAACLAVLGPWLAAGMVCPECSGHGWRRSCACARGLFAAEVLHACGGGDCADPDRLAATALQAVVTSVAHVRRQREGGERVSGDSVVVYRTAAGLRGLLDRAGDDVSRAAADLYASLLTETGGLPPHRVAVVRWVAFSAPAALVPSLQLAVRQVLTSRARSCSGSQPSPLGLTAACASGC